MALITKGAATAPTVKDINVALNHDLTFKVYEYDKLCGQDEAGNYVVVTKIINIKVIRATVKKAVPALEAIVGKKGFNEAGQNEVELHEENGDALALLMQIIHGTVGSESHKIPPSEIFELIAVADKYSYEVTENEYQEFFRTWYHASQKPANIKEVYNYYAQLMYLTFRFNHAKGFQIATKWLVYNAVGQIYESNPTEHNQLRLRRRIPGLANAAKGNLRTMLFDGTFTPIDINHKNSRACNCKYRVEYEYNDWLFKVGFYPLERTAKSKSINKLLECLGALSFEPHQDACVSCRAVGFTSHIRGTRNKVQEAFDGLCLDCMKSSDLPGGAAAFFADADQKEADDDCRISHGWKTWYFSYMGDMEQMKKYQQKKKRDRSFHDDSD